MKHKKLIFIILLIVLIGLLTLLFFSNNFFKNENSDKQKEVMSTEEKNELIEDIVDDIDENYTGKEEPAENKSDNKEYDQYLVASGYSGSNDNVYYTKDGVLYHLTISTKEITKIAEGVSKIENSKGTIEVYKGKSFKLYNDDDYLTFVD